MNSDTLTASERLVLSTLLEVCPQAQPEFEEAQIEYPDLPYLQIAVFPRQLVKSYKDGDTEYFINFFSRVEDLLKDCSARDFTVLGVLEGLQTNASHQPFGPDVFREWLGTISVKYWDALIEQWANKHSLADVFRHEN